MIWNGEYRNGLKEGEWKEGYLYKVDYHFHVGPKIHDCFKPAIAPNYRQGIEIPLYNIND